MNILCVDDEPIALERLSEKVKKILPDSNILSFRLAKTAISTIEEKNEIIDLAFLDIEMIGMSGIELAMKIKSLCPLCKICFVTGYSNYAVKSYSMHIDGYILKPITDEALQDNINFLFENSEIMQTKNKLFIKTFGNFDVFYNNEVVHFERNKSKEVLAYLIDKQGENVTTKELLLALYGDNERKHQKMLATLFVDIKKRLKELDAQDIVITSRNYYRIDCDKVDCDFYNALKGDVNAINSYVGDYMKQYDWASNITEQLINK